MELPELLERYRRRAVPFVDLRSHDHLDTVSNLLSELPQTHTNGGGEVEIPYVRWDFANGFVPLNEAGKSALPPGSAKANPVAAVSALPGAPPHTVLFMLHADRFMKDPAVLLPTAALRDQLMNPRRMLVMLTSGKFDWPAELAPSMQFAEDKLPTGDALYDVVAKALATCTANIPDFAVTTDEMQAVVNACRGQTPFATKTNIYLSLDAQTKRISLEHLHSRVRASIEAIPGIEFLKNSATFADVMGLEHLHKFGNLLFGGPLRPAVVVMLEELEKSVGGDANLESSGTSKDILATILTNMEDNNWSGLLLCGAPGTGKSLSCAAMANSFGAVGLRFDVNATKDKWVGSSEAGIRRVMDTFWALGGERVFFIASVNQLEGLRPELLRRFRYGTWFVDAPDAAARKAMYAYYMAKFGLPKQKIADETDIVGSDIRNLCERAHALGCSLAEAKAFAQPVKVLYPGVLERCRKEADGRFTCANHGGLYRAPSHTGTSLSM